MSDDKKTPVEEIEKASTEGVGVENPQAPAPLSVENDGKPEPPVKIVNAPGEAEVVREDPSENRTSFQRLPSPHEAQPTPPYERPKVQMLPSPTNPAKH